MTNFFAFLLRIYSFLFHLTLSVFLVGLAVMDYRSQQFINLDILPFANDVIVRDSVMLGTAGIICTFMALSRRFRFIFVFWTALAVWLMLKWFFLGGYIFDNAHQAKGALWLTWGAVGAFFGAAWSLRTRKGLAIV